MKTLNLTLWTALSCVRHASEQAGVFLLVDEFIKSTNNEHRDNLKRVCNSNLIVLPHQIIREIGANLDTTGNFHCLITTLDSSPFSMIKTDSGRNVEWLLLEPLSLVQSVSLFKGTKMTRFF